MPDTEVITPKRPPGRPKKTDPAPITPPSAPSLASIRTTGFQSKDLGNVVRNPDPGEDWELVVDRCQRHDLFKTSMTELPSGERIPQEVRKPGLTEGSPKSREDRLPIEKMLLRRMGYSGAISLPDVFGAEYWDYFVKGKDYGKMTVKGGPKPLSLGRKKFRDVSNKTFTVVPTEIRLGWNWRATKGKVWETDPNASTNPDYVEAHIYEAKLKEE